ncbi:MAG: hypothetical protein PVH59_09280, partial [Anaerolineae bacterium]
PMPGQIINAEVVDSSAGLTLQAGTTFVWDVDDLPPGSGGWVTVRGTVDSELEPPATIVNTVQISAVEADPVPENNSASISTEIVAAKIEYACFLPLIASAYGGSLR